MGPTGCGKSTLLETICGLRRPSAGSIILDGDDVTHSPIGARGIGYVPQDGAIFPRMSVRDNLAFALRIQKRSRRHMDSQTSELADRLRIAHLLPRQAVGLSGGESQRVALGRALASEPKVLLLDEPLSALDDESHNEMVQLLHQVHAETGVTVLHVTHRLQDARDLATTHLQFMDGKIVSLLDQQTPATPASASSSKDNDACESADGQPAASTSGTGL